MNQQLEDFYNHLNRAVVTTNDFAEGTKFRKREKVDQFAYCGLNPVYRAYLSFDLDSPASAFRFDDVNLPAPTIITVNRTNGHSHMLYRLNTPVAYHRNSRSAPQDYFEAIQSAMESRLSADTAFNHTLTKNPLHPAWEVITFPTSYDLTDFTEWIELPKRRIAHSLPDNIVIQGRNDELFHTLRLWAYSAVRQHGDMDIWYRSALAQAEEINLHFDRPLPFSEIKATARSVAKWHWKNRNSVDSRRYVLTFTDESAVERMRRGADHTNVVRRQKSLDTLVNAANELYPIYGNELSRRLLMEHTGMNIKTVSKYYDTAMASLRKRPRD
ncbi:replication initiation protein [Paraburkholderia silvatlantica]|uniref:replication initiation protein n=1 Tax=Paraburkholderia silvatlantica TaxID=321895 RepID=UPI0010622C2F|nr:replication initiation protein [Paraburkholderia silvatlantica]TDQ75494.1 primase-like protein [Paraburkholderia silvatlantica]